MGSLKLYATVAGMLAAATSFSGALAADLLPPPPPPPLEPAVADVAGGWYLRGDVGVSRYEGGKIGNVAYPGYTPPNVVYDQGDFGSGAFAGGGVGYQFNSWFRADVTGEYRFSTGFNWNDRGSVFTQNAFFNPGTGVYDIYSANGTSYEKTGTDFSAAVVLVNGYFDLGTYYGFSPFIGAGVGYAYHWLNNGHTSTVNAYGNYVGPDGVVQAGFAPTGVSGGTLRDRNGGDFAWALHAGVAYDVTPNVKLELAYRYLNMGEVRTGQIDCYCNQTVPGVRVRDLESHDVKLGMRWALGGIAAAPAYEPAPLIRKY